MAKNEEIYPEGYPRQKESFSDEQKFKFDVFEAIKEAALETTEKAFEAVGYKKKEGRAGEYGTGDSYGAGTELNHFNIRLSSRPNTDTYFEKIIYFGGKKAISEVSIGWDAKNKAIELAYKNTEFSAFRGYGSKTGPDLINDRRNFVIESLATFKKEIKDLFKKFAEKEVAYITSTKIGIEDKTEKSINSMVETSMKKFSLKDLMTSSDEDLSNTIDNYISEGKKEKDSKEDKVRMNSPEVIAANSPDKLLFDDLEEIKDEKVKTAAKNKLKKFGVVAINELKPSEKKTYFEELQKELEINEVTASGGNAAGAAYQTPYAFKPGGDLNLGGKKKFEDTNYAKGKKEKPHVKKSMKEGDTFWTTVELNPGSGYVPKGMEHNYVMGKHSLKEEYVGGVNYDSDLASELKHEVGDLNKITPYVLDLGDTVKSDIKGTIYVYENKQLVAQFKDVNDFLTRGIRYKAQAVAEGTEQNKTVLKESLIKRKFASLKENEEKGMNKRYIVTEKRTKEEEENRWKKLSLFETYETIKKAENVIEECGCGDIDNSHEVSMSQGEAENEKEFMQRNVDAEAGGEIDGKLVIMVPKPGSLSNAMFKVYEEDYLNEGKAYILDLNSGNLVANPNFKKF